MLSTCAPLLLGLLWTTQFLQAMTYLILASVFATYYFRGGTYGDSVTAGRVHCDTPPHSVYIRRLNSTLFHQSRLPRPMSDGIKHVYIPKLKP